jgi:hypothetical protein
VRGVGRILARSQPKLRSDQSKFMLIRPIVVRASRLEAWEMKLKERHGGRFESIFATAQAWNLLGISRLLCIACEVGRLVPGAGL